ncbi:hypothetical protein [Pelagerythrobacter aerophilus]|uniref:Antifreeze glycopeptide polyprotein n=1 Tax=Pelagerythrobacter aerophilus TaxID=2306995 RepID=A0A418NJZ7_9SPHN|nr:hypothetical protein [Pelagerythrobacter aerophilus]RIV79623.1 hypothetical protein D2V04_06565 [Pelagerythrobacter aerophilus]
MRAALLAGGAALALSSTFVLAQSAPESLLPPGFDDPAPTPSPSPTPTPRPTATSTAAPAPSATNTPVVQPLPELDVADIELPPNLPSLEELEAMDTDELDELLGLKPRYDIPPAARRSLAEVGVLAPEEGGFATASLAAQPASLVRAALAGTRGPLVSRWGHILLRRALASRLAAPEGMDPVDFAALRAATLNSIGEYTAARAIAQDIDTSNWNGALTGAALDAYVATGDIVGACPAVQLQGSDRDEARWQLWRSICSAFAGQGVRAGTELSRALSRGTAPAIDVLLAQRYAGAAGSGRRAVTLEWGEVNEITPWRFAVATAVGAEIPENLLADPEPYYQRVAAVAPMLAPMARAAGADRAGREGILSASAMVDLYSQIYAIEGIEGPAAETATSLRAAYVGEPAARLAAMQEIWGASDSSAYGRLVLTAYAAARLRPSEDLADAAPQLIASMLAAGLDRDAMEWASVVEQGSEAWALLALAQPDARDSIGGGPLDSFIDADESSGQRKSRFLVAALAGLGRIDGDTAQSYSDRVGIDLSRQTKWMRTIERAADVDNPALVALLAGLGMQGEGWDRMTARHLFHIVSALNRVGLSAEARMIAAEAVARA